MKAKEMASMWNASPTRETLLEIINSTIDDMNGMIKTRNIKTDTALIAALRECDTKWRAFASRVNGVNPDGFKLAQHALCPTSKFFLP